MQVTMFTEGKTRGANEDQVGFTNTCFTVADGSTGKDPALAARIKDIYGVSGGTVAAQLAVQGSLESDFTGQRLVDHLTELIRAEYERNLPEALTDPAHGFATTFVTARIVGEELIVTQVGDTGFRITFRDGHQETFLQEREQDKIDARARSEAIKALMAQGVPESEAVPKGREVILESLQAQPALWNNPEDPLGFGYVNGHTVPPKFVQTYAFLLEDVARIEIFSDGFFIIPDGSTVEDWKRASADATAKDPHRYLNEPLATKPGDDMAVMIVQFFTP